MNPFNSSLVTKLIDLALEEDLSFGDITSSLLVDNKIVSAHILAREELVACGLPLTEKIIARTAYKIKVQTKIKEGAKVKKDTVMQVLSGAAAELTSLERIILNFMQRLSGVASYTRAIIEQAAGITVLDTRKTMPAFRLLDKYATYIGGAKNHRMHLGEMILVKNNHIDAANAKTLEAKVRKVLSRIKDKAAYYVPYQVEVRSERELKAVLEFYPDAILLDNMEDALIDKCIKLIRKHSPQTLCEVSGGLEVERLSRLAALGVNAASMGRLTTKAPNVDISMRII